MSDSTDVLVLRKGTHGISTNQYATHLRERLPDDVVVARPGTPSEEMAVAQDATVITGHDIDTELLEQAQNLRLFACASAGYESLPLDILAENGVTVTSALRHSRSKHRGTCNRFNANFRQKVSTILATAGTP